MYQSEDIRNIGLFAHAGSGKTTLTEAILFQAGVSKRRGKVEEGNTLSDWEPEEVKRGLSINMSLLPFEWKGKKVNLIDTPGYMDFIGNVMGALRAVDAGVITVCAVSGVEVGTENAFQALEERRLPTIFFLNKMDREGADYQGVLSTLQERFSPKVTPLFIPIGKESSFNGVVDLLSRKALYFQGEGKPLREDSIPVDMEEAALELREILVENIAEADDELLNMYLEGHPIPDDQLRDGLQEAILQRRIFPVLAGSGLQNLGVETLIDFLVDCAPPPVNMPPVRGSDPRDREKEIARACDIQQPFSAQVFKIISDPYVGKVALFRVYSGKVDSDSRLFNASREVEEKISQLSVLRGKNQENVSEIVAGDIGAIAKISEIYIGDSLANKEQPILFPPIERPEPNYMAAVKPQSRGDEEKISQALSRMLEEDFTLKVERDSNTKEDVVYGLGDIHLDVLTEKMKRKFGVDVTLTIPRVPYKETIKATAKVEGKYKRQSGGRGQYGHCWVELEPLNRGEGFEFVDKIVGGVIPRNFIPSVEKGIQDAMQEGILAGYPVTDIRVILYDGSFHAVDSSDMAFKIAGSMALKKGVAEAKAVLLEPIMNLEVWVGDDFMGDVIGDLNSRRGKIMGMDPQDGNQLIKAQVPLAEVFRYSVDLRSITQGRALFRMKFSHYEEVPAQIAETIIQNAQKEKEEE